MIVVDTHVMIWHALCPKKITTKAKKVIQQAHDDEAILVSEISFWEIAMFIKKQRLKVDIDPLSFINLLCTANTYHFAGITPEIAHVSVNLPDDINRDPADRIICATAIVSDTVLVTADKNLRASKEIKTIW